MHQTAENGIAAHWLYKSGVLKDGREGRRSSPSSTSCRSGRAPGAVSGDFLDEIKKELLRDSIYVFTPKGDVVELPYGSTAIDFAYHIHTDIGDHCTGGQGGRGDHPAEGAAEEHAGRGDHDLHRRAHPHLDWLRYVKTSKARSKIKHWLAQNEPGPDLRPQHRGPQEGRGRRAPAVQPRSRRRRRRRGAAEPETQIRDPSKVVHQDRRRSATS